MATPTYEPIETYTVSGTSTSTVTLGAGNTLPQTYTDLVLVFNGGLANGGGFGLRYNNDTGSNYSRIWVKGDGTSASSSKEANNTFSASTAGGANQTDIWHIQNYSNSTTYKSTLARGSGPASDVILFSVLWRSTAAITRIDATSASTFTAGSTFTLYGIANADIGAKASGGVITYDSTYFYHTFGASGTFTPKQSLTADILVVAGGGGGGDFGGGGGGAGGLLGFASQSLTATGYTVTVGAGGTGVTNSTGTNGVNSQFASLTASVGGGGGGGSSTGISIGSTGGSGGGAGGNSTGSIGTSGFTTGQGSAGGSRSNSQYFGAGGGGAGAVGVSLSSASVGGSGGDGLSTYSSYGLATGTGENVSGTVWYAGGGGGNNATVGGKGGGGYVTSGSVAVNGLANTGGGGGGQKGNGGSGVVIIRYPKA